MGGDGAGSSGATAAGIGRWRAVSLVALAVLAGLVVALVVARLTAEPAQRLVDLDVYRDAGTSVLHGRDLYAHLGHAPQFLPFTYPPFAALLAVPLAALPFDAAGVLWTLGELACTVGLVAIAFRAARDGVGARDRRWWPVWLLAAAAAAQLLLPLRDEVKFGQVDELLAVLVLADLLRLAGTRWAGVLVGVAAAVKLTPAVFVLYLLVRRRWRAAATATGTFLACGLFAYAVLPHDSRGYWTDVLFHTERLRSNAGTSNQSLRGMWLRAVHSHEAATVLWIATAAAVLAVALWRAARASRAGDELLAVTLVALAGVLVSPVSWIHHFVWVVLAIGCTLGSGLRWGRAVLAGGLAAWFAAPLPWWGSHAVASVGGGLAAVPFRAVQDAFGLMVLLLVITLRSEFSTARA